MNLNYSHIMIYVYCYMYCYYITLLEGGDKAKATGYEHAKITFGSK